MKISLNYTPFRRIIRPLSLYSETTRSVSLDGKIKWAISDKLRIYGYQQPDYQSRLTVVKLNECILPALCNDYFEFTTEAPETRGMGTVTGEDTIIVDTEPEGDYITIRTDNFTYNIKKSTTCRPLSINEDYLPMENIELKGTILKNHFQNFVQIAPRGPIRLIINNDVVTFVSETERNKASFDITDRVTIDSTDRNNDYYYYDLHLFSEILKKLPNGKQIEIAVNEDLIKFRYELEDNLGHVNYYQQGHIDTSRTGRY